MEIDALTPSDARRILRALDTGSAPAEYARFLLVGQKRWLDMAERMMTETAEDRDFEVRFVRARYGGGKTHFLYCVEQEARESNWVTSFVLLKRDLVELDKFSSLVGEVAKSIALPNGTGGLSALIEQAITNHSSQYGIIPGKIVPLITYEQATRGLINFCARNYVGAPFQTALCGAYKAHLQGDQAQVDRLMDWFSGSIVTALIDERHTNGSGVIKLKPIGLNLAEEHLRLMALLCQLAGYRGLFIGVDELELIGRLPSQRKANSFQTLRALVDQNNPRRQPPATCLFLAATPEMFEDPDKFPSYKALQDRIESLPNLTGVSVINYRATVIDLDRTALEKDDLRSLAHTLLKLHELAFGDLPANVEAKLESVLTQITAAKYLMARPRLLCRCVTDLLNGQLAGDVAVAIASRAQKLQEQRERELSGR